MDLQGEQLVQARNLRAPVGEVLGSGKCVGLGGEGWGKMGGTAALGGQGFFLSC